MFNIPCVLLAPLLLGAACVTAQTYKATLVNFNDGIQCSTDGLAFDGVDDYLKLEPAFDLSADHTIAFRLKYLSMDRNYERLFDFSGDGCGKDHYFVDAYDTGSMTYQTYGCGTARANNFFKYGDGEYHNYVFTMDAAGRARIFLDGQLVAQAKKSCTAAKFNGNRVMHLIGGSVCQSIHNSHIVLEWAGIWDKVLTHSEILNLKAIEPQRPSQFYDFASCSSKASAVVSDTKGRPKTTTTITTTTTATTTTDTRVFVLEKQLEALSELIKETGKGVSEDAFKVVVDNLKDTEQRLKKAEDNLAELNRKNVLISNGHSDTQTKLNNAVESLETLKTQINRDLAATNARLIEAAGDGTALSVEGSRCDGDACHPAVEADGKDLVIEATGGSVTINTQECSNLDLCAIAQRVDDISKALRND